MWSSRFFRTFFAAFSLLSIVSLLLFSVLISSKQETQLREDAWKQLRVASAILGELAEAKILDTDSSLRIDGPDPDLQHQLQQLGMSTDVRLTVIGADGIVWADSDRDSLDAVRRMDNHRERPEIRQAMSDGDGNASRFSDTLKEVLMYHARRLGPAEAPTAVVRSATSQRLIRQRIHAGRLRIASFALTMMVLSLIGTRYLLGRIINPLLRINHTVDRMATGHLGEHVEVTDRDELGQLAESVNSLSNDLSHRIVQLRERGDQLAAVLRGMVEGVIAVDRGLRVLFANDAAGRTFDFQSDTARGRPLQALVRDERLEESARIALAESNVVTIEIDRVHPSPVTLSVHATPLPGQPCPGVVIVLYDMTRIRRLEALRQEFVANVSHELKTPLSSIKAYAETLLSGAINDSNHNLRFVQSIEDQADRLNMLIMDLISLARIESSEEAFDLEDVQVAEAVRLCMEDNRQAAQAKSIDLVSEGAEENLVVCADTEAVRQILENLVNNAIKYTPEGGRVVVRWRKDDGMALIEVEDTGIGIAPEHLDRLFERFYRVDKARSRELGGTGLGLSIVKHLVQFFQGNVGVESVIGQGTTFWVRLPLQITQTHAESAS